MEEDIKDIDMNNNFNPPFDQESFLILIECQKGINHFL
jgi:hypothetical protein